MGIDKNLFPEAKNMAKARNQLICALDDRLLSFRQIAELNASDIYHGVCLRIPGSDGYPAFITLSGDAKRKLNAWLILRPRCNPENDALFVRLRGADAGKRMTLDNIRKVVRKSHLSGVPNACRLQLRVVK